MKIASIRRFAALAFSFLALVVHILRAYSAENPVHWSVLGVPEKPLAPGASFTAKLTASIDPGWHLYGLEQVEGGPVPLELTTAGGSSLLSLGTVQASKPVRLMDPNFDKRVDLYVTKAEFRLPLKLSSNPPSGSQHGGIQVRYQCCRDTMCLPPRTAVIALPISIKSSK